MSDFFGSQNQPWNEPNGWNQGAGATGPEVALDQTYATGEPCRLLVDNPRGLIHVTGWDRPEIHVRALKLPDSSPQRFQVTRVVAEQSGSALAVRTIVDPNAMFNPPPGQPQSIAQEVVQAISGFIQHRKPAAVQYEIQVPRHAAVEVRGVSADVEVKDLVGAVRSNTVSGSTALEKVSGDVSLQSVSGNLGGRELIGRLEVNTVSGDVNVLGTVERLRGNSVSGNYELAGPLAPAGSYDFHTVSGGVTLRVPSDTRASIGAHGVSTDVSGDVPFQVQVDARHPGHREWRGTLNGGGAAVNLQTVSGRLRVVRWSGSAASAPPPTWTSTPAEPQPAASSPPSSEAPATEVTTDSAAAEASATSQPSSAGAEQPASAPTDAVSSGPTDQLSILQALERGELSVDEALRRLSALKGS